MPETPDWSVWEPRFEAFLAESDPPDAAHDREHVRRVVANARRLAEAEGADLAVVVPAAWLHDCVAVAKDSPDRPRASILSAERAGDWLARSGYPAEFHPAIRHAVAAHSFSAGIAPLTPEGRVVQDADRLDALGAVGLARCLMLGGAMGRALYHPSEPVPAGRTPDEAAYVLDHFFTKLLGLAGRMTTAAGRDEARRRTEFLREFVARLDREVRTGQTEAACSAAASAASGSPSSGSGG